MALVVIFIMTGCEQPETPVKLPPATGKHFSFEMGSDYARQIYADLETGIIKTISNESWDLAFDCGNRNFIQINGGNNALVGLLNDTSFTAKPDYGKIKWRWDEAVGSDDSLALTGWSQKPGAVWIMDRGTQYPEADRYYQFKLRKSGNTYLIEMADHKGEYIATHTITKEPSRQMVLFTFSNGGNIASSEPDKEDWDLCFLQYRWIYYEFNPPLLYNVTGVYINRDRISVYYDSTGAIPFDKIEATDFAGLPFNNKRDVIGFDWKVPVFSGASVSYRTRHYITYFIREKDNGGGYKLYKLRFIDFYDKNGVKGTPSYEIVRLQ